MKRSPLLLLLAGILVCLGGCDRDTEPVTRGNLIVIGGGRRPASVMKKFVELAGGREARIAIIPMASEFYREAGQRYEKEFLDLGAKQVKSFFILDSVQANSKAAADSLLNYSGYFFGGGDQNRLTAIFNGSKCLNIFHHRYRKGAVLGGTSAGAAIMSKIMITGDGSWNVLEKDSVRSTEGFGFLKNAIIDQHFIKRSRFNRLLALVIENRLTGIGIDESTALWVKPGGETEVLGNGLVIVLKPQTNHFPESWYHNLLTARNIDLSLYHNGEVFWY